MVNEGQVGPRIVGDGSENIMRTTRTGEVATSDAHGRFYEAASRGNLFVAHAAVTAPVIYTTAAGTGGPLIWNPPGSGVNVVPVAVGVTVTVVTTVAAALGLTGNGGQTVAPTSTTAIDSRGNALIGAGTGRATPYRVGTPANAGAFLLPLAQLHTGALTVDNLLIGWIPVDGAVVCPPGAWVSLAASATASTTVAQLGIVYEEVPV